MASIWITALGFQSGDIPDTIATWLGLVLLAVIAAGIWRLAGTLRRVDTDQRALMGRRLSAIEHTLEKVNTTIGDIMLVQEVEEHISTEPMTPESVTPRPATPQPATPQPATPQPAAKEQVVQKTEPAPKAETSEPETAGTPEPTSAQPEQPEENGAGDPITQARALMKAMEDDHPTNLLKARELLLEQRQGRRQSEVFIDLCETLFWLGEYAPETKDKERYHGEGVEYGKEAVKIAPDEVSAHLWYAANMGAHGVARGIMSSLFYLNDIEKHGLKSIELDADFFHGAPLRLMGRFYHQCPGWPVGKGDLNKAIDLLEKSVASGPNFYLNHLYLAEVYQAKRKKDKAKALFKEIDAVTDFPLMPVYQKGLQDLARKGLSKL